MSHPTRCRIAIPLPKATLAALSGLQRPLRAAARDAEVALRFPAGRALALPLAAFELPAPEALEAVVLAVDRTARQHAPFEARFDRLHVEPAGEEAHRVRAALLDPDGRVAGLRSALRAALEAYGFELEAEEPAAVTVARFGGDPAVIREALASLESRLALPVAHVVVQTPRDKAGGRRTYSVHHRAALAAPRGAGDAERAAAEHRAQLVAELEHRLARRARPITPYAGALAAPPAHSDLPGDDP